MNIVLDPLSLALSDAEVDSHIPFDPMTEAIPIYVFEEYLTIDIIEKIKNTSHYSSIKEYFLSLDELNPATYAVLRYDHFDVDKLDDIEKQIKQLNIAQTLMFCILKIGIKATHFYYNSSFMGYSTSFEPIVPLNSFSSNQFNDYLRDKTANYPWRGMYITGFDVFDSYLIIQHNTPLSDDEISAIKVLVDTFNERYNSEMNELNDSLKLNQEFNE